ncbi:MAG: MFS transporter, partial [Candidatus Limnocylindrales bacterium]
MVTAPNVPASARAARIAVSALFLVNGALIANVVPRLPSIKASLDLSNAELGAAIAAMPVGGLLAGGLAGVLIHRIGSGRLTVATGVVSALLLGGLGLAPSWVTLAGVFLVLGVLDATMDASMNAHGLGVERRYGRSILHGFHGWWSAGTMAGGALGAVAAGALLPVPLHLALAGAALVVVTLLASRGLLPNRDADAPAADAAGVETDQIHLRNAPRLLRILGPLALLGILGVMLEDAASTWSAVYLVDTLGLGAGIAAAAYVLYTAAMTVGRLTNDRWVDRWGDVLVARSGALIAVAGLVAVTAAGLLQVAALAYVGFAVVGIGASSMFPVMVAAAGSRPGIPSAHGVALVSWLARIGFVLAPTLVGIAADAVGLAIA